MKKVIIYLVFFYSMTNLANAQYITFGAGSSLSLPTGNLGAFNSFGSGIDLSAAHLISSNFELFVQTGYTRFFGKTIGGGIKTDGRSHIPLLLGVRYRTNGPFFDGFLIGAGLGFGSFGKNSNGFNFNPQLGYSFENIDLIGHYSTTSLPGGTLNFMGLKAYYKF
jgi:hypothetical protein